MSRMVLLAAALAIMGCDLDVLVQGYAPGDVCVPGGLRYATRTSFTTQSQELEEVLALVLPGAEAPHGWIVLLSARLSSETGQLQAQEVVYRVDGVDRGFGQSRSQNTSPLGGGGPWMAFDWLPPAPGDRWLSVHFRSARDMYLATIDDLRVVAFAVPDDAGLVFLDQPARQTILQPTVGTRVYQTVGSVEVPAGEPGDYLVMLGLVANESPGIASIGIRAVAPGADIWPVESEIVPRPYFANPIDEWQSFMLMRSIHSDGTAMTIDLQVDASWDELDNGAEGSDIEFVRGLALRHEGFATVSAAAAVDEQMITATDDTLVGELAVGGGDPCHRLVVAQFVTLHALGFRRARLAGAEAIFDHQMASDQTKLSYGSFAVLPNEPITLANFASTADPAIPLSVRESILVALEVPGSP